MRGKTYARYAPKNTNDNYYHYRFLLALYMTWIIKMSTGDKLCKFISLLCDEGRNLTLGNTSTRRQELNDGIA